MLGSFRALPEFTHPLQCRSTAVVSDYTNPGTAVAASNSTHVPALCRREKKRKALSRQRGPFCVRCCWRVVVYELEAPYLGGAGAGVKPSCLRPGSGFGFGLGAFFTSFLPLSLVPMGSSVTQNSALGEDGKAECRLPVRTLCEASTPREAQPSPSMASTRRKLVRGEVMGENRPWRVLRSRKTNSEVVAQK